MSRRRESPSPARCDSIKVRPRERRISLHPDTPLYNRVTGSASTTFLTSATSDRTGVLDRPAAQRPAGPTARRAGGNSPEPPAGDCRTRKPQPPRRGPEGCNCRREARTRAARQPGTRPLGAHARQQRSARQRGRPDQRQLQKPARSLEARTRQPAISEDGGSPGVTGGNGGAGGRPRAARTDRRAPRGGRTSTTGQQRGLAHDLEAVAHGPTGGRPLPSRHVHTGQPAGEAP